MHHYSCYVSLSKPSISNSSLHSLSMIRVRSIGVSFRHFSTFAVAFRTEENAFPYFLRSKLVFVDTPFDSQIAPVFVESFKHFLRIRGAGAKRLTLSPPWVGTQTGQSFEPRKILFWTIPYMELTYK